VLEETVRAVAERANPGLDVTDASGLCWSAMQGLLVLHQNMVHIAEMRGLEAPDPDTMSTRFTRLILDGLVGPAATTTTSDT
jgi:hypothetical protein